jgi:hypothetical protein
MIPIIHRVNTTEELNKVDKNNGVEVDVRCFEDKIILNHDPFNGGENFEDYLKHFKHKLLVVNIKETGIEEIVIKKTKETLKDCDFFLLDVEIPYIINQKGASKNHISARYSEFEKFESLVEFNHLADWVWIDTFTKLPELNYSIVEYLKGKKTCLVSPSRWGRSEDLDKYLNELEKYSFRPNYVMN